MRAPAGLTALILCALGSTTGQAEQTLDKSMFSAHHAEQTLDKSLFSAQHAGKTPDKTVFEEQNGRSLDKKIELFDGVSVKIPKDNSTGRIVSFEVDGGRSVSNGRGKKNKLMERILPLFIMPFLLQSAIVPMFLSMLKFMLFKSLMVGKVALFLILINAFKNHNAVKGRDSEMADVHYGYHSNGMEYGAYIN